MARKAANGKKSAGSTASSPATTNKSSAGSPPGVVRPAPPHDGAIREVKVSAEQIRKRAFELYCQRAAKGIDGDSTSDWLQAERELRAR